MTATETTTPTTDLRAKFEQAFEQAGRARSRLQAAYRSAAEASRAMVSAIESEKETARVALVAGIEHVPSEALAEARRANAAADKRVEEARRDESAAQRAFLETAREFAEEAGDDETPRIVDSIVGRLLERLDDITADLASLHGQMEHAARTIVLLGTGNDPGPLGIGVSGEVQLRAIGDRLVDIAYRSLAPRPEALKTRVSETEMLAWYVAQGGSNNDPLAMVKAAYTERGPRQGDARQDETDRTREQLRLAEYERERQRGPRRRRGA